MMTENKAIIPSELTVGTLTKSGLTYYTSPNLAKAVAHKIPVAFSFLENADTTSYVYMFCYDQDTTITGMGLQITKSSDGITCGIRSFKFSTNLETVVPGQFTSLL